MVIKNQWLQLLILVGLSVTFISLLVFVLGRWFRNNNFPKTKGSIWILALFSSSLAFILANTTINANKGIDLQSIIQGVQEVLSTFIVPVVLGIMFTTSEYDQEKDKLSKTKTFTVETVKMDTNGVGHYEKITVTEEE